MLSRNSILSISLSISALVVAASSIAQQRTPPLAEYLPKQAGIYLGISDLGELAAQAKQTDFSKILETDGIRQFAAQVHARLRAQAPGSLSLLHCAALLGEGGDRAALVVVEKPRAFAATAVIVDAGELVPQYRARLLGTKDQLSRNGFAPVGPSDGNVITVFEKKLPGAKTLLHCWFESGKFICIANDMELAQSILGNIGSAEGGRINTLAGRSEFMQTFEQCHTIASPVVWAYAEPVVLAQLAQKDPDDGIEPREVMTRHGFHQLEAMAAKIEIATGNRELEYEFFMRAPKPFVRAMRVLELVPVTHLEPPEWLDSGVHHLIQAQWSVRSLLSNLHGPFDEIVGVEGTLAMTLEDLKSDIGPGIDLQRELFDNLHAPVLVFGRRDDLGGDAAEHTIVAVAILPGKDAEVAGAVKKLFVDDENATRESIGSVDLWKIGGKKPIGAGMSAVRFKSSGVMATKGYLFLSSSVEGLRALLTRMQQRHEPLSQSSEFARARRELGVAVNAPSIIQLYYSLARDTETAYEQLRQGKIDSADSIYAQLLTPLVAANRKSGSPYDFSKLPEFAKIRHLFGTAMAYGVDTADGWRVHGFILKSNGLDQDPVQQSK